MLRLSWAVTMKESVNVNQNQPHDNHFMTYDDILCQMTHMTWNQLIGWFWCRKKWLDLSIHNRWSHHSLERIFFGSHVWETRWWRCNPWSAISWFDDLPNLGPLGSAGAKHVLQAGVVLDQLLVVSPPLLRLLHPPMIVVKNGGGSHLDNLCFG